MKTRDLLSICHVMKLIHGDCIEEMSKLPDKSIDMCLTDPPYGTTACKWDSIIPFEPMWVELKRIVKDNGAICLFGQNPFTASLIMSNPKTYRYDWIWNKRKAANFLFGNKQPLKKSEYISVWYEKQPGYYPIKTAAKTVVEKPRNGNGSAIFQHLKNAPKTSRPGKLREFDKRLPDNFIEISKPNKPVHPTQKPVALLEYLIKTYTVENETVLDFTMGSGSTGVACANLNRNFIGIERDGEYFEVAKQRIDAAARKMLGDE